MVELTEGGIGKDHSASLQTKKENLRILGKRRREASNKRHWCPVNMAVLPRRSSLRDSPGKVTSDETRQDLRVRGEHCIGLTLCTGIEAGLIGESHTSLIGRDHLCPRMGRPAHLTHLYRGAQSNAHKFCPLLRDRRAMDDFSTNVQCHLSLAAIKCKLFFFFLKIPLNWTQNLLFKP